MSVRPSGRKQGRERVLLSAWFMVKSLLARIGFLRLLPLPQDEFEAERLQFTVKEIHSASQMMLETLKEQDLKSAGSGVSLHKVNTSKEKTATFKSAMVFAFYRHSPRTF